MECLKIPPLVVVVVVVVSLCFTYTRTSISIMNFFSGGPTTRYFRLRVYHELRAEVGLFL